ncbi:MAG: hypothetical protein HY898_15010 [Deltaproteobacteria bacterium]|nr:hypothetical protein [Deltaproteobacteria bacterium]
MAMHYQRLRSVVPSVAISVALWIGCGGSATDGGEVAVDGGTDAVSESACPGSLSTGVACTSEGLQCSAPASCAACGFNSYTIYSPTCTCSSGKWFCPHLDCGPNAPGTYSDPSCTKLNGGGDAGGDGPSEADAGSACPADPATEPSCTVEGQDCTGPLKCTSCGMNSYAYMAAPCQCQSGKWACLHGDCGPNAPGTYSDPQCTIPNPGADAGMGDS